MPRLFCLLTLAVFLQGALAAQSTPKRPTIDAISHFSVYAADPAASGHFYTGELGFTEGPASNPGETDYFASEKQYVSVSKLPAEHSTSRMKAVYFATANAEQLRRYLAAKGIAVPAHAGPRSRRRYQLPSPRSGRKQHWL